MNFSFRSIGLKKNHTIVALFILCVITTISNAYIENDDGVENGIYVAANDHYTVYKYVCDCTDLGLDRDAGLREVEKLEISFSNSTGLYAQPVLHKNWRKMREDDSYTPKISIIFLQQTKQAENIIIINPQNDTRSNIAISPDLEPNADTGELVELWSRNFSRSYSRSGSIIKNYIASMVSNRSGLNEEIYAQNSNHRYNRMNDMEFLAVLTGSTALQMAIQDEIFTPKALGDEIADIPLPADMDIPEMELPDIPLDVEIEKMASCIPHECFYAYMKSWNDFEWMLDKIEDIESRGRSMAFLPIDYKVRTKIETQLAIRQTMMSKIFGDTIINSVAMIGMDPFFRMGSSMGIVFEAKNDTLLKDHIQSLREDAMDDNSAVTESKLTINGKEVSLLSKSGNTVRSFYVICDNYHLVTNSRKIVERFIDAAAGKDNLANSKEYRWARKKMPLERDDTAFVFISDAFLRNILSSKYRVEMIRRNFAFTRINMAKLARIVAQAEINLMAGVGPAWDIPALVSNKYLPENFNSMADSSQIKLSTANTASCSLRGEAGCFLPIADMEIEFVTQSEADMLDSFNRHYRNVWENLDPAIIALKRSETDSGDERITIDLVQTPYPLRTYGEFGRFLARPNYIEVLGHDDDLICAEASISTANIMSQIGGGRLPTTPLGKLIVHQVFGGLRDFEFPTAALLKNPDDIENALDDGFENFVKFYVGESPMPQLLLMMAVGAEAPDADGYYQFDEFVGRNMGNIHVVSNKREVLEKITPEMSVSRAKRPAQIRLKISRLDNRQVTPLIKSGLYAAARAASKRNADLLNSITKNLQVKPDDAKTIADDITLGEIFCPLGGQYKADSNGHIISTNYDPQPENAIVPDNFNTELFDSFRGFKLLFSIDPQKQMLHVNIQCDLDD